MAIKPSRSTSVQDDYVLLEQIAQHAGKVFRAQHVREQRPVIVRIWRAPDAASRDRFLAMARLASGVRHPVLPAVEASGCHGESTCYIVSECARGEPLDTFADRVGIPPVSSAIELFQRVCVGLNAAHRNGLVHEALNPRNLFVTKGQSDPLLGIEPCVLDLGVPGFVRALPPELRAAQFMAPEQLARALGRGERGVSAADPRMNVYSCGALLHYLCTGGAPFAGRTVEEFARAQGAGEPLPPSRINPQIPPALDAVILRALAHDPGQRYASTAELGQALERVRTGTGASGVRPRVGAPATFAFGGFDERPTSEAPRLDVMPSAALPTPLRPPPMQVSELMAARGEGASGEDAQRRTPAGLFSSVPPSPSASVSPSLSPNPSPNPSPSPSASPNPSPNPMTALPDARAFARALKHARPEVPRWLGPALGAVVLLWLAWGIVHSRPKSPPAQPPLASEHEADAMPLGHELDSRALAPKPAAQAVATAVPAAPPAASAPESTPVPAVDPLAQPQGTPKPRAKKPGRAGEAASAGALRPRAEAMPAPQPPAESLAPAPVAQVTPRPRDAVAEAAPEPAAPSAAPEPQVATPAAAPPVSAAPKPAAPAKAAVSKAPPPPLAARATVSELVVHGSLATSVVRRAVDRLLSQLEACYERAALAAGRNGFGSSHVALEIDEHGRARSAVSRGAALPGLDACVMQRANGLSADRAPDTGRVQAAFKLVFTP